MARDYRSEYDSYQGKPEQIKKRAMRNAARRKLVSEGKVHKGDGKDVDHKNGNANDNSRSNLRVQSKASNRSFPRNSKAQRKKGTL
jgi:hypothetical protein